MLRQFPVSATLPVSDLDRAVTFYEETLGLSKKQVMEEGRVAVLEAGNGTEIELYERPPVHTEHTHATFEVAHIEEVRDALCNKGVVFEEYDLPQIKTENGIATFGREKAAWFKDSEGNILCIHESA